MNVTARMKRKKVDKWSHSWFIVLKNNIFLRKWIILIVLEAELEAPKLFKHCVQKIKTNFNFQFHFLANSSNVNPCSIPALTENPFLLSFSKWNPNQVNEGCPDSIELSNFVFLGMEHLEIYCCERRTTRPFVAHCFEFTTKSPWKSFNLKIP